jgi:hypothetical protein
VSVFVGGVVVVGGVLRGGGFLVVGSVAVAVLQDALAIVNQASNRLDVSSFESQVSSSPNRHSGSKR